MTEPAITSTANPRIRALIGLRDRSTRDRQRLFVVEGPRLLDRALAAGHQPVEVFYDPNRFDIGRLSASSIVSCSAEVLSRASYRASDEGVIAVFPQFELVLSGLSTSEASMMLVVEGIEKPGNLGAILRTADAVGADAVIVVDPEIDPFNPNVVRSATGALLTVQIAVAGIDEVVDWLRESGIRLIGADPKAEHDLWAVDLAPPCALLVGAEHGGLTARARDAADVLVSIPMRGATDSLNASVTMALLAYEALRQRQT